MLAGPRVGAASVWLVLVYVSDLGTIGLAIARGLGPGQVFSALINPIQQARVRALLSRPASISWDRSDLRRRSLAPPGQSRSSALCWW
jgi:hypothetical protein